MARRVTTRHWWVRGELEKQVDSYVRRHVMSPIARLCRRPMCCNPSRTRRTKDHISLLVSSTHFVHGFATLTVLLVFNWESMTGQNWYCDVIKVDDIKAKFELGSVTELWPSFWKFQNFKWWKPPLHLLSNDGSRGLQFLIDICKYVSYLAWFAPISGQYSCCKNISSF